MVIIGFPKCGQNSLAKYLNCKLHDFVYYDNAVEVYVNYYIPQKLRPVFITRDPKERILSQYNYFPRYHNNMTFDEFKRYVDPDPAFGGLTPIEQCEYKLFIEKFKDFNPLVFRLEDMSFLMTHENETSNRCQFKNKVRLVNQ